MHACIPILYSITFVHHDDMVRPVSQAHHRTITKPEKRVNKEVSKSVSPPWLSSVLVPTPEGPMPLPIPPNTPGVELYGEEVVPVEDVVVPVPAVLALAG